MLSRLWQKFRAHWFKYLLLVACAGAGLFGLLIVVGFWAFPISPCYYQMITANPATIGNTPLANANLPSWLAPLLSVWLLVATVSFVLVLLWLRRQFSLKALLIAVFVAAGLAALPQSLRSPTTTAGEIHLMMNSAPGQYALSDAELDAIVDGLSAARFFRTLPEQMVSDLRLTPAMFESAVVVQEQTNPTSNWRVVRIKLQDGINAEQSATLCHAMSHYVGQEVAAAYARNVSPAPPYTPMQLVVNAPSRWDRYVKAWDERRQRQQLAQQPIPAPPPPSVQVQPK